MPQGSRVLVELNHGFCVIQILKGTFGFREADFEIFVLLFLNIERTQTRTNIGSGFIEMDKGGMKFFN